MISFKSFYKHVEIILYTSYVNLSFCLLFFIGKAIPTNTAEQPEVPIMIIMQITSIMIMPVRVLEPAVDIT